ARADVYAIATIAFRAITGAMPFAAKSLPAQVALKLAHAPRSLEATTGAPWPDDLEAFFRSALAREPADRFRTADLALAAWRSASLGAHQEIGRSKSIRR